MPPFQYKENYGPQESGTRKFAISLKTCCIKVLRPAANTNNLKLVSKPQADQSS